VPRDAEGDRLRAEGGDVIGSAGGIVRRIPTPPAIMMSAAAMPVRSDTCAFQSSSGTP
jgi:hypothetical protein